jgi:hypothetical protein
MDAVLAIIVAGGQAHFKNTQKLVEKLANFFFILMNLLKSFVGGLRHHMRSSDRHLGGINS